MCKKEQDNLAYTCRMVSLVSLLNLLVEENGTETDFRCEERGEEALNQDIRTLTKVLGEILHQQE